MKMANETAAEMDPEPEIKIESVWHVTDEVSDFCLPSWQEGNQSTTNEIDDSNNTPSSFDSAYHSQYLDSTLDSTDVNAQESVFKSPSSGTNFQTDAHCIRVPAISSVAPPDEHKPSLSVTVNGTYGDVPGSVLDLSAPSRRSDEQTSSVLRNILSSTDRSEDSLTDYVADLALSRSQTELLASNGVSVIKKKGPVPNREPYLQNPQASNYNRLPMSAVGKQTRPSDYARNSSILGIEGYPSTGNYNLSNGVHNYTDGTPYLPNRMQDFYSGFKKTKSYVSNGVQSNFSTTGLRIQDRVPNGINRSYAPNIAPQTRMPNGLSNYSTFPSEFRNHIPNSPNTPSRLGYRNLGHTPSAAPQFSTSVYGFSYETPNDMSNFNTFGGRPRPPPPDYASSMYNLGLRGHGQNFPPPISVPVFKPRSNGNAVNVSTPAYESQDKTPNNSFQYPVASSVPQRSPDNTVPITFPLWNLKTEYFEDEGYGYNLEREKLEMQHEDTVMPVTEPVQYQNFESDESMTFSYDGYTPAYWGDSEPDIYKPAIVMEDSPDILENHPAKTSNSQLTRKRISKMPLKDKPYICHECNVGYVRKHNFQEHIKKHTGKHLDCHLCNITFRTSLELRLHLKEHYEQHEFKCKKCRISFSTKLALTGHSKMHAADKCFKCKICERWFTTRASLRDHSETHSEQKFFKCTECDKQYATRAGLKYHVLTHDVVKPFACEECHKRFITKRALAEHVVGHFKKKYFKCDDCEKRFLTKSKLRHHEKTHATERTFHCNKCDKGFTTKQGLAYHMRNHIWERTLVCTVCDKKVRESNAYQCNMKSESEGEPFKCIFCKDCFRSNMNVDKEESD